MCVHLPADRTEPLCLTLCDTVVLIQSVTVKRHHETKQDIWADGWQVLVLPDGTGYSWDILRFGALLGGNLIHWTSLKSWSVCVCHIQLELYKLFHTVRRQTLLQNKLTEWTGPTCIFPLQQKVLSGEENRSGQRSRTCGAALIWLLLNWRLRNQDLHIYSL